MKRGYFLAVGLLLIILVSVFTIVWVSQSLSVQDSVVLKSYNSLPDAVQGILQGQVEMLPIDKIDLESLRPLESTQVKLVSIPTYDFTYIGINLRNSPLNDINFRKAMLFAFNRPKMLNQSLGRFGETLHPGLFSSAYSTNGWPTAADQYGYDPAKAETLLNNEGFNQSSPFRIDPSTGQTLRLMTIISRLTEPDEVAAADSFAKDMQSIGLPIVSLPMSDVDFNVALRVYTFDLFIDSQSASAAPTWLYTLFDSKNDVAPVPLGTNLVGYSNSTFDGYVNQLLTSDRPDDIKTAAEKCQEMLAADLPVLPVFSKDILIAVSPELPVTQIVGNIDETVRNSAINILKNPDFSLPLRIGFTSDFDNLDPTTTSNQADWMALGLLTEPLLSTDQQGNLKPALAQHWTISSDGTLITMSIRQNATFSNGQSLTVNDVVATINWLAKNTKSSSPLYPTMEEIERADAIDQMTLKVALSRSDKFAINSFTSLFAMPASRLSNDPSASNPIVSQLLVSSGPLILRELTQTNGAYMQLNNLYFGKSPRNLENIDAFEGETIQGVQVLPDQIKISSQPMFLEMQPVRNASYTVCIYDQNDVATQCAAGKYAGHGTYSTFFRVDTQLHPGMYRIEGTTYGALPNGTFIIFEEKTLIVRAVPLTPLIIVTLLIIGVGIAIQKRELERSRRRIRRKRRARRLTTVRRPSRRLRQVRKRT